MIDQVLTNSGQNDKTTYKTDAAKEKPIRSIAKSISWRIIGTLDTMIISWIVTGKLDTALLIGGVEVITKMVLYFFHERIWNSIKWGK
ncbi:hypothetical protein CJ739_2123 [Mariniflexile rhizosphaerae]|jgi:uncharacterized membrane protein|uniref:DUF2061 domain-containing protein n=1 Tax=unclassified Mariniflexile TaxID=2643887 RepID=UPI000CC0EE8F|nr:DUF2061 domain-containing protein [Mariniflexile sp. TRM1-10]AXP81204.1 hypothetical protein CJ739_2123 [Mariniflexile sp. TRM1-10]PLB18817.1 MAG: hypothetical protein TRG1_2331 [Flavobacteriaceae bacterium FS1-H7996/R]